MQMRLRELVGREVVATDGRRLGRIADVEAERVGDDLRVVALLVGPAALFGRVWSLRVGGIHLHAHRVQWEDVAHVGRQVQLSVEQLTQAGPAIEPKARADR
jgi:sporulation protein YlmC with PRC-barrel domain